MTDPDAGTVPQAPEPRPSGGDPSTADAVDADGAGAALTDAAMVDPDAATADSKLSWWDRFTVWWGGQPPRTPRQRGRSRAIRRGVLAGIAMIVVGSLVKLPLLMLSPGPTYNTIGEVDGAPLISISGTTTYPTDGALDMVTVSERGGSTKGVYLGEALAGWVGQSTSVVPREAIYGPDISAEDVAQRNDQLFTLSQSDSIAAAMNELGIPTEQTVVVTVVSGGAPADGIVQAGDQIISVNGTKVATSADVGELVRAGGVGDTAVFEVLRVEEPGDDPTAVTLEVVTEANPDPIDPDADAQPYVGLSIGMSFQAPFDIDFADSNVGGPSAGMMFSLAIIDMLTEDQLNGGKHVAGTGTIDPEGIVGPIGGIQQKLVGAKDAGAELFLAPDLNCDEVMGAIPDGLTVVPVESLGQARDVVQTWAADPTTRLPKCGEGLAAAGR